MPQVQFGGKLSSGMSQYLKLESKNDKIKFRILDAPFIEGKHFLQEGTNENGKPIWNIIPCPRINNQEKCSYCEQFFALKKQAKKETDKTLAKQYLDKAEAIKPTTFVYYPIINRETGKFALFQTTPSVWKQIEDEFALGTKILTTDFIVLRTEQPGSYYRVSRVDSAETLPLTSEEKEVASSYKKEDVEEMINGRYDADSGIAFEANSETAEDFASSL